jgi:hypothetical protein
VDEERQEREHEQQMDQNASDMIHDVTANPREEQEKC